MESQSGIGNTENSLLQWSQWQLLDSVLPTGGFAHSYGLEAAVQARFVFGPEDLKTYITHVLENSGSLLLPFVYSANTSPDLETWSKLDNLLEAMLTNEISRKASVSQGSALLRVAASVFVEAPLIKKLRDTFLSSGTASFHHAPVFGLICGLLGFDSSTSQRAYMFMTMRDVVSAATRLNLIGPLGASALQHQLAHVAEQMVRKWMDRPVEGACQTAPLLDVIQGCHGIAGFAGPTVLGSFCCDKTELDQTPRSISIAGFAGPTVLYSFCCDKAELDQTPRRWLRKM